MSLVTGKEAFKAFLLQVSANEDPKKTPEQAVDEFLSALEAYIKSATVTVPATGLVAPNGPVTGSASGQLS